MKLLVSNSDARLMSLLTYLKYRCNRVLFCFVLFFFFFERNTGSVPNDGYWAHLYPKLDTGNIPFEVLYKNLKRFTNRIYLTHTRAAINRRYIYKTVQNELFEVIGNFRYYPLCWRN